MKQSFRDVAKVPYSWERLRSLLCAPEPSAHLFAAVCPRHAARPGSETSSLFRLPRVKLGRDALPVRFVGLDGRSGRIRICTSSSPGLAFQYGPCNKRSLEGFAWDEGSRRACREGPQTVALKKREEETRRCAKSPNMADRTYDLQATPSGSSRIRPRRPFQTVSSAQAGGTKPMESLGKLREQ